MPLNVRVSLGEPVIGCVDFSARISQGQVEGKPDCAVIVRYCSAINNNYSIIIVAAAAVISGSGIKPQHC